MKNKFNFKWFFSVVLMLGIFWTINVNAQATFSPPPRDASQANMRHILRADFMAMDPAGQLVYLTANAGNFIVDDLINSTYNDFLNSTGDHFTTSHIFYSALPDKQQEILTHPDKWKIYI